MSAPGTRVATGKLRVDAARAVHKLRDYQLPDPTMWVLEVVRGAVHAKAEHIRVHGDADDVWVAWEGAPLDPSDLKLLFDDLVDPAPAAERRHLRLIATGVNTVLGLDPRYVDVFSCTGKKDAHVVRYTPKLLRADADGAASGLRSLRAERRAPSTPLAPARGGLVHVRRLPLLDAVPILIGFGEPPELSVARRACADLSVRVTVGNTELSRERSHADLLRLPLGKGLDGFLSIVDPSFATSDAQLDVAELGVLLARYTFPILGLAERRARVPLRLFVDAPRMPTNASRSAVRLEEAPVADALARGGELLAPLIALLATELGPKKKHAFTPTQRERLRAAALSLVAAASSGSEWRAGLRAPSGAYGAAIAPLLGVPLVRDALGRSRELSSFPLGAGAGLVHFGADAVEEDLSPWLGDVLWVPPGDPSVSLLGEWRAPDAKTLVSLARRGRKARAKWNRLTKLEAEVAPAPAQLLAAKIRAPGVSLKSCVSAAAFSAAKDLRGEIAILDPRGARDSTLSVRIDGREIDRLALDFPVYITAVVDSPHLTPSPTFRSVEKDDVLHAILRAVRATAVVACEGLALRMAGKKKSGDRAELRAKWVGSDMDFADQIALAAVMRGGVRLALSMAEDRREAAKTLRATKSPLLDAPAWPTVFGELRSLREILEEASRPPNAIGFASRSAPSDAPRRERLVLHMSSSEDLAVITALIEPAALVDYGRPLWQRDQSSRDLARDIVPPLSAALRIQSPGIRAAIAWDRGERSFELQHWGRRLAYEQRSSTLAPCRVVVDDERVVPDETWTGLAVAPETAYPELLWERALGRAFGDALAGEPSEDLVTATMNPRDATAALTAFFAAVATTSDLDQWLGAGRIEKLSKVPLVSLLGKSGDVSLDDLAARFPDGVIPCVPPDAVAHADLDGWHPLRADEAQALAIGRLLGRQVGLASGELELRKLASVRRVALERFRRSPTVDVGAGTELEVRGCRSARVTFGAGRLEVDVLIEGRRFTKLELEGELPMRAIVDFDETAADAKFEKLSEPKSIVIQHVAARGARALLVRAAEHDAASLFGAANVFGLLTAWAKHATRDTATVDTLARARAFPSVQGPLVALAEAAEEGVLRIARWDEAWLAHEADEPTSLDRPVIRLRGDENALADLTVLEALWPGERRDVSTQLARLQGARRIARGLANAPRVPDVRDPRFRFGLDVLLATEPDALEALAIGEAALWDGEMSKLLLFENGVEKHSLSLNLVPRVIVAAESPLVRGGNTNFMLGAQARLEEALRATISHLMRAIMDGTPADQLPPWVRAQLRSSCLHGNAVHFDRLGDTPIFETTKGGWATPKDLKVQEARFGSVWWTADPMREWTPLDDERIALRLSGTEAAKLHGLVPVKEAAEELELDRRARENRARPPVATLDPPASEREAALSVVTLEVEGDEVAHGTIVILKPGHGEMRGLHVHRLMRPLGQVPDPCAWPCAARIEHPDLTPNRTWDGPEGDATMLALRGRIRTAVDREILRLMPFPARKHGGLRLRAAHSRELGIGEDLVVEGMIWLEDQSEDFSLQVHEARGTTAWRANVPIAGALYVEGPPLGSHRIGQLAQKLAAQAFARLADDLANEPPPTDRRLVLFLRGLALGLVERKLVPHVSLPSFAPERVTLSAFLARLDARGRVPTAPPEEIDAATRALGAWVLVTGTPVADALLEIARHAATPWQREIRNRVLPDELEPPPEAPPQPAVQRSDTPRTIEGVVAGRLLAAGVHGIASVRLARRKRPIASFEDSILHLAASHPAVRRAEQALELQTPELEALLDLLCARIGGQLHRHASRLGRDGELALMIELLS